MQALPQLTFGQGLIAVLVFCRVAGLVATAPAFGAFVLPLRIRALLALAITLVVAPACAATAAPHAEGWLGLAVLAGNEVLTGAVLGIGVAILLSSAQIAGQLVSQLSGVSLSDVLQPEGGESTSAHGQLVYLVALAAYVALGGQRLLIGSLLETFRQAPPGTAIFGSSLGQTAQSLIAQSFDLGVRGAAPALAALLLSTIALAIVGRSMAQLGTMSLGLGVNSLVTLAVLTAVVGLTTHLVANQVEPTLSALVHSLTPGVCPNFWEPKMGLSP